MKRNYLKSLFTALLLLCCTVATAHDFEVDAIYYNILSEKDKTVEVTYRGSGYGNVSYSGDVTIPANVTYNSTSYSVTTIGEYAFYNCSSLTSITIPNSVTTIWNRAFVYTGLTSIVIPKSVTTIDEVVFGGCDNLTSIVVAEGNPKYDSREGCNAIIETATNTLIAGCQNTIIPNSVTTIKEAFVGLSNLTSIEIPNSVTTIEDFAFSECYNLTNITIGNSVTTIEYCAFWYCSSLSSITSHIPAEKLFAPESNAFYGVNKNNCTLYVPFGAKETYATTSGWNEFTNIVELPAPDKEFILNDGDAYTATLPQEYKKITYNRTFNNKGWQAWYVPFAVDYNKLKDDFDVAEINDMHQYDDNNDGQLDRMELEIFRVTSGTLEANYPYLVRAKSIGSKSIVVENTVLETAVDNTIDCSSVKTKYSFVGTLSGISGNVMYNNGYYALGGGRLVMAEDNTVYLKPLRWYMNIESRNNVKAIKSIGISFADEITSVEDIVTGNYDEAVYYDLSGRRVENPTTGIYIVNGRKVIIK